MAIFWSASVTICSTGTNAEILWMFHGDFCRILVAIVCKAFPSLLGFNLTQFELSFWRVLMKADTSVTVDVRAIDVGYFSTKLTLGRKLNGDSNSISTAIFPSLAPRLAAGMGRSVALSGKTDGCVVDVGGASYFVGQDVTLHCSGREPREILDDYSSTDKYKALLLGAFHYIAEDANAGHELVIRQLVLGLPMNTFAENRDALRDAATGEHLLPDPMAPGAFRRVTVLKTTVIVQPQGALLNNGRQDRSIGDGWAVVVDAGGGTLDWYVAKGRQPNWNRSGAHPKSMIACANAVADRINPVWRDNFEIIERIDKAIRTKAAAFKTGGRTYEMAPYAKDIEDVLRESTTNPNMASIRAMRNSALNRFIQV
jgi:plasmid segregation protein ParM